jgi:hypothetical protein
MFLFYFYWEFSDTLRYEVNAHDSKCFKLEVMAGVNTANGERE